MMVSRKKEEKILFLWGLFVGFVCFFIMFGAKVLDVTYDAWIFYGDIDLRQHYLGWCHYRMSNWHFPLGMIDSLSYPHSVSVIWTDSIPLFALFFKIFRSILPKTFQYLGLFTFLSFGLQGGLSAVVLRQVTNKKIVCLFGVFPFILSFPILQRCFYHTALSAQWLILLALYLWLSDTTKGNWKKKMVLWGGMSVLCVMIHSYFIPMTALIMVCDFVEDYVKNGEWKSSLWGFGSFVVSGLFTLFVLGAFSGSVNTNYGIGGFGCNLNTFFNPLRYGSLLKEMPLAADFQYEGYGYLGVGILFLLVIDGVFFFYNLFFRKKRIGDFLKNHKRFVIAFVLFFVFLAVSMYPELSWNEAMFFRLPVPRIINQIFGFFRSNGRFIMPAVYLLMLFGFAMMGRYRKKRVLFFVLALTLILQAADLSGLIIKRQKKYNRNIKKYQSELLEPDILASLSGYRHFVMMYDDVTDIMDIEYCAYKLSMTNNRFYYARDIDAQVEESLLTYREEILEGDAKSDCIFVFDEESYKEMKEVELYFYRIGHYILGTKEPIVQFQTFEF